MSRKERTGGKDGEESLCFRLRRNRKDSEERMARKKYLRPKSKSFIQFR